jgi:peptidoglycan hydrolase-like protein with peptidoglycan-binding domain
LVLLAILFVMALTADTRIASAAPGGAEQGVAPPSATGATPFDRHGMWIWYVDRSDGGSVGRIVARAKRAGIGTLYIKAGDGDDVWSQFNKTLVGALHQGGIDVCAWQFVYGDSPVAEARVGAAAVRRGADCLVIDAEGQYEGKYAAADLYIRALRGRIGPAFPLSLAAFPYVDYHPSFPYSVFFGPEGATVNQPQMYWKAIGTSVRAVYEHTFLFNRLWDHPLHPLGQTYGGAGRSDILRFRRFAESYGGLAPSWWDWQETSNAGWGALGTRIAGPVFGYRPVVSHPVLKRGSAGDLVVWAQEHLRAVQPELPVTGIFGKQTGAAVRSFQVSAGLAVDGAIGTMTWRSLLNFDPVRPRWAGRRAKRGDGAVASRALPPRRPLSASLPATAYEIDPGPAP